MTTRTVRVCIADDVYAAIADTARRTGRAFADAATELLTEAARMRHMPGIVFADSTRGRVARIAGTGLEVWEVVEEYRAVGEDWEQLRAGYDWLSEPQLRAALAYAAAYPDEIEAALQENAAWTPAKIRASNPVARP